MGKMAAATLIAHLVVCADATAILVQRSEGSPKRESSLQLPSPMGNFVLIPLRPAPIKWRQIVGVVIGCVVWFLAWLFIMKWLIGWNRRKREEIESLKTQLERDYPGFLAKEGISPPSHDQEKAGFLRQLLCPCLSCLPGSPTQGTVTRPIIVGNGDTPVPPMKPVTPPETLPGEDDTPNGPSDSLPPGTANLPSVPQAVSSTENIHDEARKETVETVVGIQNQALTGHQGRVNSVAFSHDSQLVASASSDSTIKLWDMKTSKCRGTLVGHTGGVESVIFSHDSRLLISGSEDCTVKIWNARSGECKQTLSDRTIPMKRVRSVACSHDSSLLASASSDGYIRVWETATGACKKRLMKKPAKEAWAVVFSQDSQNSQWLVSALSNGTLEYWDLSTDQRQQIIGIYDPELDQIRGFVGSQPTTPGISPQAEGGLSDPGSTWSVAFSPDLGKIVSVPPASNTAELFVRRQGVSVRDFQGKNHSQICSIAMSRDMELLAAGSKDRMVNLWHVESGKLLKNLEGHSDWVSSVAFSHDSKLLASGSEDCTVRLWDLLASP